jgi:hypothetical protein
MYGFVLGTGFATRTPAPWPQLLAVASLAVGSPTTVVIAWAVYGGARAIVPIAARRRHVDSRMITTYTTRTRHAMHLFGTAIAALLVALPFAIR